MRTHPMFQRILAGTDGSLRAEEAVRQGARLARVTGAAFEVVHVARPGARGMEAGHERLAGADRFLHEARMIAAKEEVEADVRVLVGDPAETLAAEARRRWTDLVCVGPDAGFLEKPHVLGGVTVRLVHLGSSPVLVSRPATERTRRRFPSRVLAAVDGSAGSLEAVGLAAALAAAAGAEMRILHVVPVFRAHGVGWTEAGDREGFEPLEPAVELARDVGVAAAREMSMGRPGPAIAAAALEWDADLIAVGDRGLSGLGRVALGSVSDWVVRHSGRSVLVVRRPPPHRGG